jgi:glycosyltransferase involved in cell wall biosynthesis
MVKAGIDEDKLIPIYNSLDYEKQLVIRTKLRSSQVYKNYFGNDFPTIIYVGRIQKSKKIDAILRCMRNLKDREMFCNFVIIGGDVDGENITSLVEDLGLKDSVWFYGACYDEEKIGELIYNAQVCISPGPVGLTAIHSLTYGTPVISNNNFEKQMPEFESIIPKVTGDFFEDDDMKDLEVKMAEWLFIDADTRISIRSSAYHMIDGRYNPLSQIKILKSLLL